MLDRQWMAEQERKRDASQQMFQAEQARLAQIWQRGERRTRRLDMRISAKWHRRELWVLGGVIGILTIIAAIIQANWWTPWWKHEPPVLRDLPSIQSPLTPDIQESPQSPVPAPHP